MIANILLAAQIAVSVPAAAPTLGRVPSPTVALPAPKLVPSPNTFFQLAAPPLPQKQVFALYMLCCGFGGPIGSTNGGLKAAEEDIIMAQQMGITGFALTFDAWDSSYQAAAANMFAAAAALNSEFKLFINASTIGSSVTAANIINAMETYASNPYYFTYNGQLILSTFSGEGQTDATNTTPAAWWTNEVLTPLRTAGINIFFVPGFQPTALPSGTSQSAFNTFAASQVAQWNSFIQGLMNWDIISLVLGNDCGRDFAAPLINAYASALNGVGKVWMPGINTKYWGSAQPTNGNIYYEFQGGANMEAQWGAAITNNVPWVEILTWNDPNESYIQPMDDYEKYNNWGNAGGWWKPSFGYAEMLRYYIAWFRTGVRPTITRDAIIWFYRTHPASATATSTSTPNGVTTGPVTRFIPNPPSGAVPANADQIYTTVFATAPGTVSINGTSQPVVAGVNQLATPFVAGPAPAFSLSRNGTTVVSGTGADAILAHPPYYDWWNSSGFVEGP